MFRFLQKAMKLLENHKIYYKPEVNFDINNQFDELNAEY